MNALVVRGQLKTHTALHIGSGHGSSEADALLRRDAAGEPVVPGSALAGALRALATRLAPRLAGRVCQALQSGPATGQPCGCPACHLFGDVNPQEGNTEESGGRAARLWIYDARLLPPGSSVETEQRLAPIAPDAPSTPSRTWIRDGVGIDRRTGAAARRESVKFDLEVLPAGAAFSFHLELEEGTDEDQQLLAVVLAEWQSGRGALGGRVARGLGALRLESLECRRRSLDRDTDLLAFLRGQAEAGLGLIEVKGQEWLAGWLDQARRLVADRVVPQDAGRENALAAALPDDPSWITNPAVARSWIEVGLTLQASGPFLVNDLARAGLSGLDHAPLVEGRPLLPGASLRGILRSQAERIARTLATEQAADRDDFLQRCPACSPVARRRKKTETIPLDCCDDLLDKPAQEEVAEEELCLACRLFGSPRRGSRLVVEDAPLLGPPMYKVQDFLAIDRFTGGGRDGAKFDAAVLWQPAFEARLRLENPQDWELGWLALVLRDLAEGLLTVGFGRAKGWGHFTVPRWTVTIGILREDDFPAGAKPNPELVRLLRPARADAALYRTLAVRGSAAAPPNGRPRWQVEAPDLADDWIRQVASWVERFVQTVEAFRRGDRVPRLPPADNYFGSIESLYPRAGACLEEVRHVQ